MSDALLRSRAVSWTRPSAAAAAASRARARRCAEPPPGRLGAGHLDQRAKKTMENHRKPDGFTKFYHDFSMVLRENQRFISVYHDL